MPSHIQFAGAKGDNGLERATQNLYDRSPLIDLDKRLLYIKLSETDPDSGEVKPFLQKISSSPDNVNIVLDENNNLALSKNINVAGITTQPGESAPAAYGNILIGHTDANSTILLLTKICPYAGVISGELLEKGEGVISSYHFSISNTGSRSLEGASNLGKAAFVQCMYKDGEKYYGIKFPSGIPADIYFHGYDSRDPDALPPEEYYDSEFSDIEEVNASANYAATIKTVPYSAWDFTVVPDTFNNTDGNTGLSNGGVSFGGGLLLWSGHPSLIRTNATCNGPNGTNTGYLQIGNSMRITQDNWIQLTVSQACTINVYFSASVNGRNVTMSIYDSDKETIVAEGNCSSIYNYTRVTYENTSNEKRTFYICTEGGAARFYYISNYNPAQISNNQLISDSISTLPETGEDGEPNKVTFAGLKLKLTDLQTIANLCKDSDYKVILDLSNCEVDSSDSGAVNWNTPIFADCNSLDTLYMPAGVRSIGANVFSGCSFMQHLYVNKELANINGSAYLTSTIGVLGGTQVREIRFKNDALRLGGFWATASALRFVFFSENFDYSSSSNTGFISNVGNSDWLSSVPSYMKLCFYEKFVRHIMSDGNKWWFSGWGDGYSRSYAYYGVDSKGNYLLAPLSGLTCSSWDWNTGAILYNNQVIYPAR